MCKYTREQIAGAVDLAALKPEHTISHTLLVCNKAARYNCASVCVKPCFVTVAAKALEGSGVAVGTVINFPHGSSEPDVAALEAYNAIGAGAVELDMVMNVGAALSDDWSRVKDGIEAVTTIGHEWGAIVKVILETCYLTSKAIWTACDYCVEFGTDFVKTSTGFGTGGATPFAVKQILGVVGDFCQVKASGGISTYKDARTYLDLGCTRLGSSKIEELFPYEEL